METITIHKGTLGNKRGWAFSVYYGDNKYPNITSALFRTKKEVKKEVENWKKDGLSSLQFYGSAE